MPFYAIGKKGRLVAIESPMNVTHHGKDGIIEAIFSVELMGNEIPTIRISPINGARLRIRYGVGFRIVSESSVDVPASNVIIHDLETDNRTIIIFSPVVLMPAPIKKPTGALDFLKDKKTA